MIYLLVVLLLASIGYIFVLRSRILDYDYVLHVAHLATKMCMMTGADGKEVVNYNHSELRDNAYYVFFRDNSNGYRFYETTPAIERAMRRSKLVYPDGNKKKTEEVEHSEASQDSR